MRQGKPWLGALAAVLLTVGCGRALPVPSIASPDGLFAGMPDSLAQAAASAIRVEFNDTYQARIDLNEPRARKSAQNTDKSLLRLIRTAQHSLDGAFYDISDPGVTNALIAAKNRGVRVRLVTDSDSFVDKHDPTKPREVIVQMHHAGIPVVGDGRSAFMHHKFLVADGKTVWTGSTNVTTSSLYQHNNNALTLRYPQMAAAFTQEFERMFIDRQFGVSTRPAPTPTFESRMGGSSIDAFFSPRGGGREAVVRELRGATKSIRFMTFSLTDPETGQTIINKAKSGVQVEGIFDRWLAAGKYSLFPHLQAAGLKVRKDGNEALMHHKVIIIDDQVVITGSYNYSQNAENNNNEAFLIIRDMPHVVQAYNEEFKRLQYASFHNRPPAFKPKSPEIRTGEEP